MAFFSFLQKNKLFIHYLTIIIVVAGILSLFSLRRESRPNVNFNRVAVSVAYPGASPQDIEELIIDPIEEKISEVDGVEEFRSVSFSGAGSISIKIDDEYPDPNQIIEEIRRKISEVKNLPDSVDDPVINEIKAENFPILKMALYGDLPSFQMQAEVEKLKDYLKTFSDVQSVTYSGVNDLQFKIFAKPELLFRFDITIVEVIQNLNLWSNQKPGGLLENQQETANVTVGTTHNDLESLKNRILRSNSSGNRVSISDVANVSFDTEKLSEKTLFGSKNAVLLTITKKPFADAITTVEKVKKGLSDYTQNFPKDIQYKFYTDESKRVRDRLEIVSFNALFGLLLVVILLIVFLDWRSAIVTSLGLPVAILGGVIIIYLIGQTLNSLVLLGIVIVLGMLVDDAIVVCENIYSYIESGMDSTKASLHGVAEISVPVIATVLTTVFAFFPIIFMKGIMGQFLSVIPITVVAMLALSLFEALVILPVHSAEIMRKTKKRKSYFKKLEQYYESFLKWSLKNRYLVVLLLGIFLGSSYIYGQSLFKRFTLFPAEGLNGLSIRLEANKNISLHKTQEYARELAKNLESVSQDSFDSLISTIGKVSTGGASGSRQHSSNLAMLDISFTTDASFLKKEKQIVADIKKVTKEFSQNNNVKTSITLDRPGPPIGKPIQLQITARNLKSGEEVVQKIKEKFQKIKGVYDIETDLDRNTKSYRFVIDNEKALSDGVSPTDISQTIFASTTGLVSQEVLKNNQKVDILVGVGGEEQSGLNIKEILNLRVRNKFNQDVAIEQFTKYVEEFGPSSIQRLNGLRTITLFAEVDESILSGKEANQKISPLLKELDQNYRDVSIQTGGGEKERMKILQDTMKLYILALLMIFMVISLSFQSVYYPFLVLLAIPMGICGVVWALILHGQLLTLMGTIGIVGLSGVVVNVSIVLLKFIQDHIKKGFSIEESIIQAGVRRFRPIIITTLTTLLGLAPTIYGIGGVDIFVQPIALVLGWGLLVGTLLTLLALPSCVAIGLSFKGAKK